MRETSASESLAKHRKRIRMTSKPGPHPSSGKSSLLALETVLIGAGTPRRLTPFQGPAGYFSRSWGEAPVLMSSESVFDASPEIRLRSSLSSILDVINVTPFDHNVHLRGFWPKQLMAV